MSKFGQSWNIRELRIAKVSRDIFSSVRLPESVDIIELTPQEQRRLPNLAPSKFSFWFDYPIKTEVRNEYLVKFRN